MAVAALCLSVSSSPLPAVGELSVRAVDPDVGTYNGGVCGHPLLILAKASDWVLKSANAKDEIPAEARSIDPDNGTYNGGVWTFSFILDRGKTLIVLFRAQTQKMNSLLRPGPSTLLTPVLTTAAYVKSLLFHGRERS